MPRSRKALSSSFPELEKPGDRIVSLAAMSRALRPFCCGIKSRRSPTDAVSRKRRIQTATQSDGELRRPRAHVNDSCGGVVSAEDLGRGVRTILQCDVPGGRPRGHDVHAGARLRWHATCLATGVVLS